MKSLALLILLGGFALAGCGGGDADVAEGPAGSSSGGHTEDDAQGGEAEMPMTALSYLMGEEIVGSYPHDIDLWNSEPLHGRLQSLLGEEYDTFVENMQVVGPVAHEDGLVYIMGNRRNYGGVHSAVLVADTAHDNLKVWMLKDGAITDYVESDATVVKAPNEVSMYISNWTPGS